MIRYSLIRAAAMGLLLVLSSGGAHAWTAAGGTGLPTLQVPLGAADESSAAWVQISRTKCNPTPPFDCATTAIEPAIAQLVYPVSDAEDVCGGNCSVSTFAMTYIVDDTSHKAVHIRLRQIPLDGSPYTDLLTLESDWFPASSKPQRQSLPGCGPYLDFTHNAYVILTDLATTGPSSSGRPPVLVSLELFGGCII
jgi:hypothetical protein